MTTKDDGGHRAAVAMTALTMLEVVTIGRPGAPASEPLPDGADYH